MNLIKSSISVFALAVTASCLVTIPASAQNAKPTPREILAGKIKTSAYTYASDPANYNLVQDVEKEAWKMIRMSEGLSSCALPTYDLVQRLESFNATYIQMKNIIDAYPANVPDQIKQQAVSQTEAALNGQKAAIAKVLDNVLKYCK